MTALPMTTLLIAALPVAALLMAALLHRGHCSMAAPYYDGC
jgi:hypothetical protein